MERAFIATKESKYVQDYDSYIDLLNRQKDFVNKFCKDNNIEANEYLVRGNGFVNQPFKECSKKDISFSIIPTANDLNNFSKMLTKPDKYELFSFKKNSKIAKDFAQKCIDEQIVINLYSPKPRDYFKSMSYMAYSYQQFEYDDTFYIMIKSEYLEEDDTPDGFVEIKMSEFYKVKEEYESRKDKEE